MAVEATGADDAVVLALAPAFVLAAGEAALTGSAFLSAVTVGATDSAGVAAGDASTVAEAFSSAEGATVDSAAGEADSSWANAIAARKVVARSEMIIFMDLWLGLVR